jgi:3-phosphoshikimate 1-carboxyvinyltransferase
MNNSISIQFKKQIDSAQTFYLDLPASKSISNRILMLQHLYFPQLIIRNLSEANDTVLMQQALKQLSESNTINVKDAGTVARFITAAALFSINEVVITGTPRMQVRPMNDLIQVLDKLGASIVFINKKGLLPFKIKGNSTKLNESSNIELSISTGKSSQFLSALIMIAPKLNRQLIINLTGERNSWSYVDMTIKMMRSFGFKIDLQENRIKIEPYIPQLDIQTYNIENDWSAASFIIQIISNYPNQTNLNLNNLLPIEKSIQGDAILCQWAGDFNLKYCAIEDCSTFIVENESNSSIERSFKNNPDLVLPYVVSMVMQKKKFTILDVDSLKYKESDRIASIETELNKCNVTIKKAKNGYLIDANNLEIKPNTVFNSHNDHRVAMCLAPLAMYAPIIILNPDVVNKSFPKYWDELIKLNFEVINH